MGGGNNK